MKNGTKLLIAVMIAAILVIQVVNIVRSWKPDGVRITWPDSGMLSSLSFDATGHAWVAPGPEAVESIEVLAVPSGPAAVGPIRSVATRQVVKDRGTPILTLPFWSAPIDLPAGGEWTISASVRTVDGRTIESAPKRFQAAGIPSRAFVPWSVTHIATFGLAILMIIGIAVGAGIGKEKFMQRFVPIYAVVILADEIFFHLWWFSVDGWTLANNLVLHLCSLAIILLPLAMVMKPGRFRNWFSEILYFWGTGAAVQAIIFPDVGAYGFPTLRYITFFLSHTLIITGAFTLVASGRVKITLGSLGRFYLFTNLLLIPMYFLDQLIALAPPYAPGSYFLLGYPPPQGSVVDIFAMIFGPTPWYIIGFDLMGIGVFGILWLPWAIARKLKRPGEQAAIV